MSKAHCKQDQRQGLPFFAAYLICALSLSLCACASTQSNQSASTTQHAANRSYQEAIQLSGRISIQYQQNEQEQSLTVNFEWQQDKDRIEIILISPTGQTIAKIKQDAQAASLEQPKQETLWAADIERLLNDNLGWSIPVVGLKSWLQGFDLQADGRQVAIPTNENFLLQSQGWDLRFVTWQERSGSIVPKRLDLKRSTPEFGEVKIRITVDE